MPNLLPLVLLLVAVPLGPAQNQPTAIRLAVDASEAPRKILHARLVIPAAAGPLTLQYPKWIPGEHGPTGPIENLAGLKLTAGGEPLAWRRDPLDMYAFHCDVPAGARTVEASLDFLLPVSAAGFSSAASATAQLAVLSWNQLLLYPRGRSADELQYAVSVRLPPGWKHGTALPVARESGETIDFRPVSLTTLVDSPLIAGRRLHQPPRAPCRHRRERLAAGLHRSDARLSQGPRASQ